MRTVFCKTVRIFSPDKKREKSLLFDEIALDFCSYSPYNSYDKERSVDPVTDISLVNGVCASVFMPVSFTGISAELQRMN